MNHQQPAADSSTHTEVGTSPPLLVASQMGSDAAGQKAEIPALGYQTSAPLLLGYWL